MDAGKRFTIDTKASYAGDHPHTKDKIIENVDISVKELGIPQVNVYYLHMPDRNTPLEEAVAGMNEAHKAGKIKQFGVSNHSPAEVEEIVKIAEEKGYIKPTVYQGQYNAIVRGGERDLFPVLRKHNIAFYAYRWVLSTDQLLFIQFYSIKHVQDANVTKLFPTARLAVASLLETTRGRTLDSIVPYVSLRPSCSTWFLLRE